MANATLLMSTWEDGLLVLSESGARHELPGRSVCGLTRDDRGVLAIVDLRELRRRIDGEWQTLATSDVDLACCIAAGGAVYAGTNDARVLRFDAGRFEPLTGLESVPGRERWYAGSAVVDGRVVGPPLGIRSLSVTCEGVLLANVHVGGIPRSADGGASWQPTIEIDVDVHEVRAHPTRPEIVAAAAAAGLCVSRDGGATWTVEHEGLHAQYCSAVAFAGDDVLVAASEGHFAPRGAVYRRSIDASGPLERLPGMPEWLSGICDTGCIAAQGSTIAIADQAGDVYLSVDSGASWSRRATGHGGPSGLLIA